MASKRKFAAIFKLFFDVCFHMRREIQTPVRYLTICSMNMRLWLRYLNYFLSSSVSLNSWFELEFLHTFVKGL